jgi:hypothetical protein
MKSPKINELPNSVVPIIQDTETPVHTIPPCKIPMDNEEISYVITYLHHLATFLKVALTCTCS